MIATILAAIAALIDDVGQLHDIFQSEADNPNQLNSDRVGNDLEKVNGFNTNFNLLGDVGGLTTGIYEAIRLAFKG
jgi:hypothetical protein